MLTGVSPAQSDSLPKCPATGKRSGVPLYDANGIPVSLSGVGPGRGSQYSASPRSLPLYPDGVSPSPHRSGPLVETPVDSSVTTKRERKRKKRKKNKSSKQDRKED